MAGNGQGIEVGRDANTLGVILRVVSGFLGAAGAVFGALKFPTTFKLVVIGFVILFWGLFEFVKPLRAFVLGQVWRVVQGRQGALGDRKRDAQVPAVRWGLAALLLLFVGGWGVDRLNPPPTVAEMIYYMVVLDASDAMREPFDRFPSKWNAVQEAFQKFYDQSHLDSYYGLVLIGGQNPQEGNGSACSIPSVPMIPVVSRTGNALPHRKLTLPSLQEQVEGQQPDGDGSLSRAFFLAKNQLESLPVGKSMVIVLIANASDGCAGKIDWDTLAGEIERVNKTISVRKELILLDVEANQEVTAFAEKMNALDEAAGTSNTYVQVVTNYAELELSISFILARNEEEVEVLQIAANTAQSGEGPSLFPIAEDEELATPMVIVPLPTQPRRVVIAASATSTPTLTPTFTLTFTPTPTFTPTFTFTPTETFTPTLTYTPTTPAPIIVIPIATTKKTKDKNNPPPPPALDRCGALCVDGTTSTSTGTGTCSSHGGVQVWLYPPNCP